MLTLALLASRGFWDPKKKNQDKLAASIKQGLDELAPLKGDWKLVWGPGNYRYLGSAFDSSMMFVLQHTAQPSRFAIVVRGTNPVATLDWLLGDFLCHRQVPWHPGDDDIAPGAKLSLSTALGLKILLNMRAENDPGLVPKPGRFDYLLDLGARTVTTVKEAGDASLASGEDIIVSSPVGPAYDEARKLVKQLLKYQKRWNRAGPVAVNVAAKVVEAINLEDMAKILKLRQRLIGTLDRAMGPLAEAPVAMLMPGPEELHDLQPPGIGLLELLGNLADTHGDALELYVTGHSKGGALAPALALFLSDTQRNEEISIPHHYQWNPLGRAKIYCYAFAGPTPGNTAFAGYFNRRLGRNFYRYANKIDIVTLAWKSEDLRTISSVFGDAAPGLPGLDLLFGEMACEVEDLDYCHPGQDYADAGASGNQIEKHVVEFSGPLKEGASNYLLQELHQHVDAYIAFLGLDKVTDLKEIMLAVKSV